MPDLASIEKKIASRPAKEQAEIAREVLEATQHLKMIPNVGPQMDAYYSKADVVLFGGEPGGGKLLALDTPIPTPFGWTTMGELQVGDAVLDEQGMPCSVSFKSAVQTEDTYRLEFSDGAVIVAGAQHQWVTRTRRERVRALKSSEEYRIARRLVRQKRGKGKRPDLALRNTEWAKPLNRPLSGIRTTREIYDTLRRGADHRLNHSIDVSASLTLPERDLLIDPYVLGVWLGDGTTNAASITGLDEEIFAAVANFYDVRRGIGITHGVRGLQTHLKAVGVFGNKHIPAAYLRASHDQRLALLQGLMDTDGHCDVRGQCEIQLVRRELIDGVAELLATLGIKAQMREGKATLYGRVVGPKWRLKFLTDLPAFRLPRKLIRQKRHGFRGTHDVRYITAVAPVARVPMQCIQVDSPNHMYLCGRAMIPTHNTGLVIGLALDCHKRSLIMRRRYTDLAHIIDETIKFNKTRDGFNGSPPPSLKNERVSVQFGAANNIGDEHGFIGQPRDLLALDEACQFAEIQVRTLMAWVRSEDPKQRCRTILATNPPLTSEGTWVVKMFAPWLDPQFPNPAAPGELRWVVSDDDDGDRWVDGPAAVLSRVNGEMKMVEPMSRTYIPSSVSDNPFYVRTNYQRTLDNMPPELREILLGGFKATFRDADHQVIPTDWVRQAQERWLPRAPVGVPMCAVGVDPSGGGADPLVIATRHDGWFGKILEFPAKSIPKDRIGSYTAGMVIGIRRDGAIVVLDMGGGYGGASYENLRENGIEVKAFKGAEKSAKRTVSKTLGFYNRRSEVIWRFREALDPDQSGGSPIMLPPDPVLLADLTAPRLDADANVIKVENKDEVVKRLGRSTNRGDAVVIAWSEGPKAIIPGEGTVRLSGRRTKLPQVIMGRQNARR